VEAFVGKTNELTGGLTAQGTVIVFEGTVVKRDGKSCAGVKMQLWQADGLHGRYDHERFRSEAPTDPGFGYYGKVITDEEGRYRYRTIIPPPYPAGPGWHRSRHVHLAILASGEAPLCTELHFASDAWVGQDLFLLGSVPGFAVLLVAFAETPYAWEPTSKPVPTLVGRFDIVL